MMDYLLSLVLFTPLLGAVLLMFAPRNADSFARYFALAVTAATFVLSLPLFGSFVSSSAAFQFVEMRPWIPEWGISYHLGVDGISLFLVLLTTFLSLLSVWFSFYVEKRVKEYMVFFLILETGMLGVFMSLDLILFYVFFEATLIPMYFLIGIWGGKDRLYAAVKFFLYTFVGSLLMLIAIIVLFAVNYQHTGRPSFNLLTLQATIANQAILAPTLQMWLFAAFAVAFAIKVPLFPFHTWLPNAHVESPTAGSVILAGILLKMGTYGYLRFCLPLFPEATQKAVPLIMILAVIGIVYGAIVAAMQSDVKKLVAYSSVAHLGFVMLGLFALNHEGLTGSILQQINHGVSTGALFLLVGIIYERRHTRLFAEFGGLKAQMPLYAALFLIIMLSSVGLPSMNGFIGEFLCLLGAFKASMQGSFGVPLWIPVAATAGVILAAVYLLWMFQKMFYGRNDNPSNQNLKDARPFETVIMALLVVFVFWLGLYPKTFTDKINASVAKLVEQTTNMPGKRPAWESARYADMHDVRSRAIATINNAPAKSKPLAKVIR